MRRSQTRHTAAFLVDHNRSIGAADTVAQRGDKVADLIGRDAVAAEEDEAERIGSSEKIALEGV